jgi:hypothetical protein
MNIFFEGNTFFGLVWDQLSARNNEKQAEDKQTGGGVMQRVRDRDSEKERKSDILRIRLRSDCEISMNKNQQSELLC